jgi:ribosomal protein S18 acetylase RimI-like enzyme
MSSTEVVDADLNDYKASAAILRLLNMYALDQMGGTQQLSAFVNENLIEGLKKHPTTKVFLAYVGEKAVGLAVCFLGFSTFAAKPLLNIHDFAVDPDYRGRGIAKAMLEKIEGTAASLGCCKLTLEVLEKNHRAKSVYQMFGFNQGQFAKENGGMLFFTKSISQT